MTTISTGRRAWLLAATLALSALAACSRSGDGSAPDATGALPATAPTAAAPAQELPTPAPTPDQPSNRTVAEEPETMPPPTPANEQAAQADAERARAEAARGFVPPALAARKREEAARNSIAVGEPNPSAPDVVDASCKTDADCAIKDVGSCCGYRPACVNRASPTFPERVKEQCARSGRMGICGFPAITGCKCTAGKCEGTGAEIGQ